MRTLNTRIPSGVEDIVIRPRADVLERLKSFNHEDRDERLGMAILKLSQKPDRFEKRITKWKHDHFDLIVRVRNLSVPFDIHKTEIKKGHFGFAVFVEKIEEREPVKPYKDYKKYISPTKKAILSKQNDNKKDYIISRVKKLLKDQKSC